jgi:predicted enzyme related to lactoylglutathione lyase
VGQPVVHFEIMGSDAERLRSFYADLFDWTINADNPMNYGIVDRAANLNADGIGIGGGIGAMPEGAPGHVTVYVEVPDVEGALAKAESLGGTRLMGPEKVTWSVSSGRRRSVAVPTGAGAPQAGALARGRPCRPRPGRLSWPPRTTSGCRGRR